MRTDDQFALEHSLLYLEYISKLYILFQDQMNKLRNKKIKNEEQASPSITITQSQYYYQSIKTLFI